MWKIVLNIVAILALAFAVIYRMNYGEKELVHDARSMGVKGGDFVLPSGKGEVKLSDYRGKVVVLYFGFASCPDVCPMALSYLNGVLNKFERRDEVQVIFVSVDHKRDTPERVAEYARFFNDDFIGAGGSKEEIDRITKNYNVYYKFIDMPKSEMGYTVDHTSKFFIINRSGEVEKVVSSDENAEVFRKQLSMVVDQDRP